MCDDAAEYAKLPPNWFMKNLNSKMTVSSWALPPQIKQPVNVASTLQHIKNG
jgi:hypothetical protein